MKFRLFRMKKKNWSRVTPLLNHNRYLKVWINPAVETVWNEILRTVLNVRVWIGHNTNKIQKQFNYFRFFSNFLFNQIDVNGIICPNSYYSIVFDLEKEF